MRKLTALFICAAMFCGLGLLMPDICAKADTLTVIDTLAENQQGTAEPGIGKLLYEPQVQNTSEMPETVRAFVKKEPIHAVLNTFERGEAVKIIGKKDDLYIIADDYGNRYFVEKNYIRTGEDPEISAPKDYYAAAGAAVYSSGYLAGNPERILAVNDIIRAEDALNGVCYGSYENDGTRHFGYISMDSISETELSTFEETDGYVAPARADIFDNPNLEGTPIRQVVQRAHIHVYEQVGNSFRIRVTDESISAYGTEGYIALEDFTKEAPAIKWDPSMAKGSGGRGGGSSSGGGGPSYGQDILLGYRVEVTQDIPVAVFLAAVTPQTEEINDEEEWFEGTVFTDGLELIAAIYEKGDELQLIEKANDVFWTVLVDGKICTIPAGTVRLEGEPEEPEMEEKDAFIAEGGAKIYNNPELSGTPIKQAAARVKIHIYEQVGDALRIQVTSESVSAYGVEGYISVDEYTEERPEIKWDPSMAKGSGGGGSGGSSGGGGSDWSVPVL